MQQIIEDGVYSKNNIFDMETWLSISKTSQVYKLKTNHHCHHHLLHLDQAADKVLRLWQMSEWSSSAKKQGIAIILYQELVKN